ncbi:hypothetical protein [Ottowia sp. VDI28]|uniref:hypothetical protein n=1 Tax=Ottowia sp. VDI28 TaxID=3133968 RepID=UPI003C2E52D2
MFGDLNPRSGARKPLGHMLVYRGTNVAVGSATNIPYDVIDVDSDSIWTPSLNAAVIERAGLYFMGAFLRNGSLGTSTDVRIHLNGTAMAVSAASTGLYNQVTCMAILSVGDQISASLSNAITVSTAGKLSRLELFGPLA